MSYDGIILKIDNKLFLFILNPDTDKLMDGISISDHKCYDSLKLDQLVVVDVIFKDGTQEIEYVDLEEFIYGDTYGELDTFLFIQDRRIFTINDTENNSIKKASFIEIIETGNLQKLAKECIKNTKEEEEDE